jgi:putative transposase
MFFRMVLFIWEFVLDVAAVSRLTEGERGLEILLLRQQLGIVERKQERGPQIARWQKVPLAVVAVRLKQNARHSRQALEDSIRLFKPATVIGWHRAAVRRKWTYQQKGQPGRPPIDAELEQWILRVARDNPGLGYDKLKGELRKLGWRASPTTIRRCCSDMGFHPRPNGPGREAPGARFSITTKNSFWRAIF